MTIDPTPVHDLLVTSYAASVRARLRDLTATERDELAADLEADLGDLVMDRGAESLPDPAEYAEELRLAGGFSARAEDRRDADLSRRVEIALDDAHARWLALVDGLPGAPWQLVVALRPTWWVLRAWIALSLVDLLFGSGSYNLGLSIVPSLMGWGGPLLAVAVLGSLLIGLRRLWPGRGGVGARLVLLALNLLAAGVAPVALLSVTTPAEVLAWYGLR